MTYIFPVAVIPRATNDAIDSNGFTIDNTYRIVRREGQGAIVRNDNGHERSVGFDGASNAHLQVRNGPGPIVCAGYFEVVHATIEDSYIGDGIYASYDGSSFALDLRMQAPQPDSKIVMDVEHVSRFLSYVFNVYLQLGEQPPKGLRR